MFYIKQENLFVQQVEALVNPVNCVGKMGKGVALEFKQKYPENYEQYKRACNQGQVLIRRMLVVETGLEIPKYIINFPTKIHWRSPSQLEYIEQGLDDLVRKIEEYKITSIAIPALGCGNGNLG